MTTFAFNAQEVDGVQLGGGPIEPEGWYPVAAVESEVKAGGDNGTNIRINVVLQVLEGPNKGRKIYEGYNLVHGNAQTVEIARKQYAALHLAIGAPGSNAPAELHNRPFRVRIKTKKDEGYEPKSTVTGYARMADEQYQFAWLKAAGKPADNKPANVAPPAQTGWTPPAQPAPMQQAPQQQFQQQVQQHAPVQQFQQPQQQFQQPAAAPQQAPVQNAQWVNPGNPQPWDANGQVQQQQAPVQQQAAPTWTPPAQGATFDPNAMPAQGAAYPGPTSTPSTGTPAHGQGAPVAQQMTNPAAVAAGQQVPPWMQAPAQ